MKHVPVLIAGGGPVGLTLARGLAVRGVRCMVAEANPTTTRHPKMDITNARSMELFARMGLGPRVRAAGVPEDHVFDVSYMTTMSGHELCRFRYPSAARMRELFRERNDGAQPHEPPMRVSQIVIEPVLKAALDEDPTVEVRFGVRLDDLRQDDQGVTATLIHADGERREEVRCDYLVGCDGGRSRVRACLGIELEGRSRVLQRFLVHFRSEARGLLQRWGQAWHYRSGGLGTVVAQDDKEIWTLHSPPGMDERGSDPETLLERYAGVRFDHQVLVANPWSPHSLVATAYRLGRAFLAGDAAHQYVATGGYGMNTGIGDAADLAWKLAAVLQGFGGPALLDSYERERRPIGLRNRDAAWTHTETRLKIRQVYDALLPAADTPDGDVARRRAGAAILALGNAENESLGVELGYAYADSPIVCGEAGSAAPDDRLRYHPTTVPGARLPASVLGDGTALYDRLGPEFSLLVFNGSDDGALAGAARRRAVPLRVVRLDEPAIAPIYQAGMVLVRPDQHVAWRGESLDDTDAAEAVIARATGWTDTPGPAPALETL